MKTGLQIITAILLLALAATNTARASIAFYSKTGSSLVANDLSSWNSQQDGSGSTPPNFNSGPFYIQSGHNMTLSGTWTVNAVQVITINSGGSLDCGTNIVNGTAPFTVSSGGMLKIGSVDGITSGATAAGNIQVTGIRSYNAGATYVYNGSSTQVTGNGLPASVANLTINNAAGVTLSVSTTVTGTLTLTSGILATSSSNLLTIGSTGTISGGSATSFVNGPIASLGTGDQKYPVGKGSSYRPVTLAGIVGTSPVISVEVFNGNPGGSASTGLISISTVRYWAIVLASGTFTSSGSVNLTYGSDDGVTDYANLLIGKQSSAEANGAYTSIGGTATANSAGSIASANAIYALGGPSTPTFFVLGNGAGGTNPLPVELTSFSAAMQGANSALLVWQTATEVNNYRFEVERRRIQRQEDRSQMVEWMKIGFVAGNGTTNSPHEYSFTDAGVTSGSYAYRLKQIDNGGAFKYSQETAVIIGVPAGFALGQNFPNPFNPSTVINYSITSTSNVMLKVYNILGGEVATLVNEAKSPGSYSVTFNASALANGVYFYRLNAGQLSDVKRLTVMK